MAGYTNPDALCSTEWLAAHIDDPDVRVVDGSFHLPTAGRNPHAEYLDRHLPGAVFFDIDTIRDPQSDLPHMLPPAGVFAEAVGAMGIGNDDRVIAYDAPGSMSAPRVWWTFRALGHRRVTVLDGGMAKWLAEGRPTTDTAPSHPSVQYVATFDASYVRDAAAVLAILDTGDAMVVDNRPPGRFAGTDDEPRPALKRGHIPGAVNVPFQAFMDADQDGTWRDAGELAAIFRDAGVDPARPLIASCGSGVTACFTALAAHLLGRDTVAIYDGSWAEWGNRHDTPVATGPAP